MRYLNLIVVQSEKIGDGYLVAQAAAVAGIEILELSITGSGALIILNSPDEKLESAWAKILEALTGPIPLLKFKHLIKKFPEKLFKNYLSLENAPLEDKIFILETESIGELFLFLKNKYEDCANKDFVFDLRFLRGSQSMAYAFLTEFSDQDQLDIQNYKITWTGLPKLHASLKSYIA